MRYGLFILIILLLLTCHVSADVIRINVTYDGDLGNTTANLTFTQKVTAGTGSVISTVGTTIYPGELVSGGLSDEYTTLYRSFYTINTSVLGNCTINSAVLTMYGFTKGNALGSEGFYLVGGNPLNSRSYVGSDFARVNKSIVLSDTIPYGSFAISYSMNNITITNLSYINKTGDTVIVMMLGWDKNESFTGSWSSGAMTYLRAQSSDDTANRNPFIIIDYSPTGNPPIAAFSNSSIVYGEIPLSVQFYDTSTLGPTSWYWDFGDGTNDTAQNPLHTYTTIGNFNVSLNASNAWGSDWENKTFVVNTTSNPRGSHPFMFFRNINETAGFGKLSTSPWSTAYINVQNEANYALTFNTTLSNSSISSAAKYARSAALYYQYTKDLRYANASFEILKSIRVRDPDQFTLPADTVLEQDNMYYALAFDWIANDTNMSTIMTNANYTTIILALSENANRSYYIGTLTIGTPDTLAIADRQGNGYVGVSMMGEALAGYTNTSIKSSPQDWRHLAPYALCTKDDIYKTVIGSQGILWASFNKTTGFDTLGSYKYYMFWSADKGIMTPWISSYAYIHKENTLDVCDGMRNIVKSEIYSSLPNKYHSDWGPEGNFPRNYARGILHLLNGTERSNMRWYHQELANHCAVSLLPDVSCIDGIGSYEILLTEYDWSNESVYAPTTGIKEPGIAEIIHGGWTDTSDWLSLMANSVVSSSSRDMMHADQLSFEYYSRGNVLLSDAGEVKDFKLTTDMPYGYYDVQHNIVLIENPSVNFTVGMTGMKAHGPWKGSAIVGLSSPAFFKPYIHTQSVDVISAYQRFNELQGVSESDMITLPSYIRWDRSILRVFNDYVVVSDRLFDESGNNWIYKTNFRLNSLDHNKSWDNGGADEPRYNWYYNSTSGIPTNPSIGNVNGTIFINGTYYEWLNTTTDGIGNGSWGVEWPTSTLNNNHVVWKTNNSFDDITYLNIFSSPASNITHSNFVSRTGGYYFASEVKSPIVYYTSPTSNNMTRVSVLISNYTFEIPRNMTEVSVVGIGSVVKLYNDSCIDYVYRGIGKSSFDTYETDADIFVIRKYLGNVSQFIMINGTYINDTYPSFKSSIRTDFVVYNKSNNVSYVNISGSSGGGNVYLNFYNRSTPSYVKRDGVNWIGNWVMNGNTLNISTSLSEHTFEFDGGETLPPIANFTSNVTYGSNPLPVQFNDTSLNNPTEWNWTFGAMNYSSIQNPNYTFNGIANYTVILNASNANGFNITTGYINVSIFLPIVNFTADHTFGNTPLMVSFTDITTNSPTTWNWTFGDGTNSTLQHPVKWFNISGNYTISLNVTNYDGIGNLTKLNYIRVADTTELTKHKTLDDKLRDSQALIPIFLIILLVVIIVVGVIKSFGGNS